MLKCHSVPVNRNWFPVVAASVGVASIGDSPSVAFDILIAWSVWTPVVSGCPKQIAVNFTGIVLFNLNARIGSLKVPPFPSSTAPPIGDRNPLNTLHAVSYTHLTLPTSD